MLGVLAPTTVTYVRRVARRLLRPLAADLPLSACMEPTPSSGATPSGAASSRPTPRHGRRRPRALRRLLERPPACPRRGRGGARPTVRALAEKPGFSVRRCPRPASETGSPREPSNPLSPPPHPHPFPLVPPWPVFPTPHTPTPSHWFHVHAHPSERPVARAATVIHASATACGPYAASACARAARRRASARPAPLREKPAYLLPEDEERRRASSRRPPPGPARARAASARPALRRRAAAPGARARAGRQDLEVESRDQRRLRTSQAMM